LKQLFFKLCGLLLVFLCFYYFWHFLFNFVYMSLLKNSENFYVLLFNGLEILSNIFGKSFNIFLKNIDIWNPKLFTNSIIYYLFFLLPFSTPFFPISRNQTCQKIINIFVVLYYTDYRFYQRILENSWILIKKNRDIVNTKHFQNPIVYYLLFNFLVFLTSFFLFYLSMVLKKFLKFLCCFIVWVRDFIQKFCKTTIFFFKKNWDIWNP